MPFKNSSSNQARNDYGISQKEFNNLFSNKKVKKETLDALKKSAADGNLNAIDMLHNLALKNDDVGKNPRISYLIYSVEKNEVR